MGDDGEPLQAIPRAPSTAAPAARPRRRADVEAALREADAAGRSAWPGIALDAETFAAHAIDRVRGRSRPADAIASLNAADLFLACACAEGNPAALAELERVHLSRVRDLVRRFDPSPAFADDVAQVMRETLLVPAGTRRARIAEYSGRGALSMWVRVVAVRSASRLVRERRRAEGPAPSREDEEELPGVVDPELNYLKLRYAGLYEDALRAALAALPDRDALLLKLHYVDGLNIDRIGALFGVHRATVARWRTSIRCGLLASMREHLRRRASLTAPQFESLLGLVRSQLDVSLRGALLRPASADGAGEGA